MKDNVTIMFEDAMKNKLGSIVEQSVYEKYEFRSFIINFFHSDLMKRFYEDCTVFSQGHKYILALYKEEMNEKGISVSYEDEIRHEMAAPAFWIGYLFAAWYYMEGITGNEILEMYDFDDIYDSYDMLHTQSIPYAVNWIKNEFRKEL